MAEACFKPGSYPPRALTTLRPFINSPKTLRQLPINPSSPWGCRKPVRASCLEHFGFLRLAEFVTSSFAHAIPSASAVYFCWILHAPIPQLMEDRQHATFYGEFSVIFP